MTAFYVSYGRACFFRFSKQNLQVVLCIFDLNAFSQNIEIEKCALKIIFHFCREIRVFFLNNLQCVKHPRIVQLLLFSIDEIKNL